MTADLKKRVSVNELNSKSHRQLRHTRGLLGVRGGTQEQRDVEQARRSSTLRVRAGTDTSTVIHRGDIPKCCAERRLKRRPRARSD